MNVSIDTVEQYIKIWNIPKKDIKEVYKIGSFEFRQNYLIKIFENTHSLGSKIETIELLSLKDLEYLQKNYKVLHIGAIQGVAKSPTRLELDKPIYVCLCDPRHNSFQDSLLGVMESNIIYGPVYFDYYLNLELSCIDDLSIHKALTLIIQTKGYDMDPKLKNILIVSKVYYKAMTSSVDPRCLLSSPKGKTILFQANDKHSSVMVPQVLP